MLWDSLRYAAWSQLAREVDSSYQTTKGISAAIASSIPAAATGGLKNLSHHLDDVQILTERRSQKP